MIGFNGKIYGKISDSDIVVENDLRLKGGYLDSLLETDDIDTFVQNVGRRISKLARPEFSKSRADFIASADTLMTPLGVNQRVHVPVVCKGNPNYVWDFITVDGQPIVHLYHFCQDTQDFRLVFTDGWDSNGTRYTAYQGSFYKMRNNGLPIFDDLQWYKRICYRRKIDLGDFCKFVYKVGY